MARGPHFLPYESDCRREGFALVAGVDEVGRGCLAGPVVAAAVILPQDFDPAQIHDSKQLSESLREQMANYLHTMALAVGVGEATVAEVDTLNILRATLLAMERAVAQLHPQPQFLLIDGNTRTAIHLPQQTIVKGDATCLSIAAASIVAKVHRDHLMKDLALAWPGYGFDEHKGYGTEHHREAISRLGPSPHHRRTFRGVLPQAEQLSLLPRIR